MRRLMASIVWFRSYFVLECHLRLVTKYDQERRNSNNLCLNLSVSMMRKRNITARVSRHHGAGPEPVRELRGGDGLARCLLFRA